MAKTQTSSLLIRTSTWIRDSYGLFDYENTFSTVDYHHIAATPCTLCKCNTSTFMRPHNATDPEVISQVSVEDKKFTVSPSPVKSAESMWLVASSLAKKQFFLKEQDQFKLGRIQFKVRSITLTAQPSEAKPDSESTCKILSLIHI